MEFKAIAVTGLLSLSLGMLGGCGSGSGSQTTEPTVQPLPTAPSLATSLQEMLDNTVGNDVPGLILHVEGPEIDFTGVAGVSDIEIQEPMQPYHQMPVGSAGKKATALSHFTQVLACQTHRWSAPQAI